MLQADGTNKAREYVVRTSGTYRCDGVTPPPLGPNDHPFFASAGPDGYFTALTNGTGVIDHASDNIYSFGGR
jgi:hypothetical protein